VPPKLTAPTTATAAAYGPHAESIAYAAGRDVTIVEWPSGELVRRLHAPSNVTSLSIATDGSIAAGSADGSARIWNPNGDLVHVLPTRGASNAEVSLSPEGTRLVVGTSDGFARVWALPAETLELELDLHMAGVTSAHFNHDGTEIVTASLDGDAKVWNAETGGEVRILRRHNGDVSDAQFSPDGNWVVTAGPMTAGLWDASSGSLVFLLRGHRDRLTSAAFDWSSSRIVTSSVDGSVRTYRCDICGTLDVLVPLAEKRLAAGMPQR
jgi:WD40 repeat protein